MPQLARQKEALQEGLEAMKQKVAALRADINNQKMDDAALLELAKRLRTAKGIISGEIEADG